MLVDVVSEDSRWETLGLEALAERGAQAALRELGLAPEGFEIAVLGCDDARIAVLNTEFRGKPAPTNVLSWPSEDRGAEAAGDMPDLPASPPSPMEAELGDIAISFETCAAEAAAAGKPLADHCLHLIVHGVLHLLGFDHIRDQDATLMEGLEVSILGKLGLPDPYCDERAGAAPNVSDDE
ncbi:rRNA maturation RNase YbeY [Litorivita sp. NS0012-18]|uniref:rRNA maturation RNase YbeY n=1 Tax=Litorivita sp. NS0012-18 TaxID=3127655 RepID=UPI00310441A0